MDALTLTAGAVAGRALLFERSSGPTHTDGSTMFVPHDENSTMDKRPVLCQAALIAAGSLDDRLMRTLSRSSPGTVVRYLGLEVVRACKELDHVLPTDLRAAVAAYEAEVGVTASAEDSLRRARGGSKQSPPPAWFGRLSPRAALRGGADRAAEPSDDELADALARAMQAPDEEEDEGEDRSRIRELLSSPIRNPLGDALLKMLGSKSQAGEGTSGGGEVASVLSRPGLGSGRTVPREASPLVKVGGQLVRGQTYPEWDHLRGRYREDWCTVGEFDQATKSDETGPSAVSPGPSTALLRELARLGLVHRLRDGEQTGDELDLAALVDHRARVTTGLDDVPRVYRAAQPRHQELGALVLLDATGSTAEKDGPSSVFDAQRELTAALTFALDRLGVRSATYAFYSRGRGNVRFLRCKSFDERWGLEAQHRLRSVRPDGFTRLGATLRHGTHMLDAQAGTRRRLLLVIGDGIPYDDGYEGAYALEDSRRAVDEAAMHAVACVGLSASPTPHGESIWPHGAHCVVSDPDALARDARAFFGRALHRAAQRSITTRHS